MRTPLAPDWCELSLRRSNACVPQRSQLFNRASRKLSVSGKPCLRDHLSITTIFPCTVGWSLKTGFTVHRWLLKLSPLLNETRNSRNFCQKAVFLFLTEGSTSSDTIVKKKKKKKKKKNPSIPVVRQQRLWVRPETTVFCLIRIFVCLVPLTFQYKKLAELIFRYWRRVWGDHENRENISRKQRRPGFTLPFVWRSVINTWRQHVSRLRVIDTNLRQIAHVRWGSSLRINHFPLSPWQKWPILNVHNFVKNKEFS